MKFVKTSKWIRLRGQMGPNREICKIDTPVENKSRIFFVPETEDELSFFSVDLALNITNIPLGPASLDAEIGDWGWRFYDGRTPEDMKIFADSIVITMNNIYEHGISMFKGGKKPTLN